MDSFTKQQYVSFIVLFIAVIMYPKVSIGYGYKKNEDPLITVFKSVVFHGRKNNWTRVEQEIDSIRDRIVDVKDLYDVQLIPRLDAGLAQHDFQKVINTMANLVFLSIREKFYWNLAENLQVFTRAKVRLRLAEEYYILLLSGNVRKYDKHKNTNLHDALEKLKYRSLRFLNIQIDKPEISKNTWMYIPEKQYIMTRIQEPNKRSPHNAPEGKTSLILEVPCFYGDKIWNMDDNLLFMRCVEDLLKLGIDIKSKVIDYFYTEAKHAYPIYQLDYKVHLEKILSSLNHMENVLVCGRNGLFRYIFIDRAMEMGFDAAMIVQGKRKRILLS